MNTIIAAICGAIIFQGYAAMSYQKSDHFDGKKFFNPDLPPNKGFWDFLKWQFTGTKAKWPEWQEIESAAKLPEHVPPDEAALTFINHATVLIQYQNLNVLTDPVFSQRASPFTWLGPARIHSPGLELNQLPAIHVVLISHNHYDHMDEASIKQLSKDHNPLFIVPLGNKKLIEKMGAQKIVELDWWQSHSVQNVSAQSDETEQIKIHLVPAHHWSARGLFDRNEALWGGFVMESASLKIYFAGDTGYGSVFQEIQTRFGAMDLSLLPIGAYEPRWFMKQQHMNPEDAVQAHLDLKTSRSMGIHFGTFQLTDEAVDEPVRALSEALIKKSVAPEDFFILPVGGTRIIQSLAPMVHAQAKGKGTLEEQEPPLPVRKTSDNSQ